MKAQIMAVGLVGWSVVAGGAQVPAEPEIDPAEVVRAVRDAYRSASSYTCTGKAITRILNPAEGTETSVGATFTMKLARPTLYRITWTQQQNLGIQQTGAVWNDGDGAKLYLSATGETTSFPSDAIALSAATGVSLGAAHQLPSLFFNFVSGGNLLDRFSDVRLEGQETVTGVPCHILTGTIDSGIAYRLWVTTDRYHILQFENTLGGQASGNAIPDITPQQEEQALQATGMADTPENREHIRATLAKARALISTVRGTMRQLHESIVMDVPMAVEEFTFTPPDTPPPSTE